METSEKITNKKLQEIHDSQIESSSPEKEEEPKYGSPEWYAWLQSQADPVNSSLYY